MKRKILVLVSIFVILFTASCSFGGGKEGQITVRTTFGKDNFCYDMTVPAKDMRKIKRVLSSKDWVFDYNEELTVTSKYKIYWKDQSFYVAPDTDYVFLRVTEGEAFEWRKADVNSKIAKKALALLNDAQNNYSPSEVPSDWVYYCLYNPMEDGQPKYYAKIDDEKALTDALEGLEYMPLTDDMIPEFGVQYSIMLNRKQYYLTNDGDKTYIRTNDSWVEIAKDSREAKTINEILEKSVDIEVKFWSQY